MQATSKDKKDSKDLGNNLLLVGVLAQGQGHKREVDSSSIQDLIVSIGKSKIV